MKNQKSVAVICSLLLMGPSVLSTMQSVSTPVVAAEENEQSQDNLVRNGDFSQGTDYWDTWSGYGGDATFTVEDEQAVMTIHEIAGMHPDWGIPISWSTQFQHPGIVLEGNMRYEISFDAKASVERPIVLERTGLSGNPKSEIVIGEEMETYTVSFSTLQPGTMMLNFLIGNVQHSGLTTPEEEHTLTFDNFSVRLIGEVEEDTTERDWQLTWSDEFDGEELDLSKWTIDTGNGFYNDGEWISGWGNNEDQYYHEDNVRVEDGRLILEAREEYMEDEHGEYDYTSGKILTRDKFYQTYGRFEASMKLPAGQGFWPAFWMMPQDDTYGGWAASGEIDIMENAGAETDKTSGAIHYGGLWPNNTYSHGEYNFQEGSTTEFNTYAVEWEPEEIRWYVNDELFYRTSEWHTAGYEYPAPFNQDFFLILNLAVGGWFGGNPEVTAEFPGQVEVDYVRVYEDANADYDTTPSLPIEEEEDEDDGLDRNPANWQAVGDNLVTDGNFSETTSFGDPDNIQTWNIFNMADHDPNGGKGVFSVVDEVLNVDVQQVGWNWWQIQFFQNLTLEEGTYKLAFDMTSEEARDMRVELVGSGEGIQVFPVNSEGDSYEFIFHVGAGTERLLFGFGRENNEPQPTTPYNMTLDNVVLTAAEPVEEAPENNRDNDNHNRGNHEERGNKDNENHNRGNHENRGNKDNSNRNTDNNGKSNR